MMIVEGKTQITMEKRNSSPLHHSFPMQSWEFLSQKPGNLETNRESLDLQTTWQMTRYVSISMMARRNWKIQVGHKSVCHILLILGMACQKLLWLATVCEYLKCHLNVFEQIKVVHFSSSPDFQNLFTSVPPTVDKASLVAAVCIK